MFNSIKVNDVDTSYTHSIFDISDYNSGATYADLSAALAAVPESKQHAGMSISYKQVFDIDSGAGVYVQYRLMSLSWSTDISDWLGVDEEPVKGSNNLVKSGGVANAIKKYNKLNLAIDSDRGVLKIGEKMYKLIEYSGEAEFDEDIDYTIFIVRGYPKEILNPEWTEVITDFDDKILYGMHTDGTEYQPDLSGYTMTVDGVTASVNSIVNNLK